MEKTTLYLPAELLATYSSLSRQQCWTRAELMRDALREYVERQEHHLPEWVGMAETNGEVNSMNVKDWMRNNWTSEGSSSEWRNIVRLDYFERHWNSLQS